MKRPISDTYVQSDEVDMVRITNILTHYSLLSSQGHALLLNAYHSTQLLIPWSPTGSNLHRAWNLWPVSHSSLPISAVAASDELENLNRSWHRLRKIDKLGPYSMWCRLLHEWDHMSPRQVYEKVRHFWHYFGINVRYTEPLNCRSSNVRWTAKIISRFNCL